MNDLENLILSAGNGELNASQRHQAFGELVYRFQDTAFGWAFAVLGDVHMAQDAVQEAFVAAYQNLGQLRQPAAFSGWFKRIVVTQCHRLARGKRVVTHSIETTGDLPSPEQQPADLMESDELSEKVLAAIQALPEPEQIVTELYYLEGYSQKEIASSLKLPLTTVKKRLQYARSHLKGLLYTMADALTPPPQPEPRPAPVHSGYGKRP